MSSKKLKTLEFVMLLTDIAQYAGKKASDIGISIDTPAQHTQLMRAAYEQVYSVERNEKFIASLCEDEE